MSGPDARRSTLFRSGPDPGRSTMLRTGPDAARSTMARTGPDAGRGTWTIGVFVGATSLLWLLNDTGGDVAMLNDSPDTDRALTNG